VHWAATAWRTLAARKTRFVPTWPGDSKAKINANSRPAVLALPASGPFLGSWATTHSSASFALPIVAGPLHSGQISATPARRTFVPLMLHQELQYRIARNTYGYRSALSCSHRSRISAHLSLSGASTRYQVKDQGNHRNNQEQVNETCTSPIIHPHRSCSLCPAIAMMETSKARK
jgi:hypothetical protein